MEIKNCVLVTVSISHWDANSLDRVVSKAVAAASGVKDQKMCRLRKSLLPKTRVMDQLLGCIRAARTFHYENTHSWVHEGPRILTRANFDAYMRQMRRFESEFKTNVLDFCAQYDDIKATAQDVLGQLYKESDYPESNTLLRRYSFEVGVLPMPVANTLTDFGLDEQEAQALKTNMENDMAKTFAKANQRMWDELYARLEKLSNKLNEESAYVMDETIAGVKKLSDLFPRINLTEDSRLDVVAKHLSNTLEGVTSQGVKVNASLRARVAKETRQAMYAMQAIMRPPVSAEALAPAVAHAAVV